MHRDEQDLTLKLSRVVTPCDKLQLLRDKPDFHSLPDYYQARQRQSLRQAFVGGLCHCVSVMRQQYSPLRCRRFKYLGVSRARQAGLLHREHVYRRIELEKRGEVGPVKVLVRGKADHSCDPLPASRRALSFCK